MRRPSRRDRRRRAAPRPASRMPRSPDSGPATDPRWLRTRCSRTAPPPSPCRQGRGRVGRLSSERTTAPGRPAPCRLPYPPWCGCRTTRMGLMPTTTEADRVARSSGCSCSPWRSRSSRSPGKSGPTVSPSSRMRATCCPTTSRSSSRSWPSRSRADRRRRRAASASSGRRSWQRSSTASRSCWSAAGSSGRRCGVSTTRPRSSAAGCSSSRSSGCS